MNRIEKGYQIWKQGKVHLEYRDEELIQYTVEGSKCETYLVSVYDNDCLCDCHDYQVRHKKEPGSYICKHLYAVFFEIITARVNEVPSGENCSEKVMIA